MGNWFIYSIGFLAQALFSSRLIIQWIASEKHQRITAPILFWTLSLVASVLLFIYGFLRDDFSIMFGQTLTYYIYIRNLQLQKQWQKISKLAQSVFMIFPILLVSYFLFFKINIDFLFYNPSIPLWLLLLGSIAQILFALRFIYQWLYSEVKKESQLPFGFWLISLLGSILIIIYATFRLDWVLLIAHFFWFNNILKKLIHSCQTKKLKLKTLLLLT